jgi:short-subunit dehydrogenase
LLLQTTGNLVASFFSPKGILMKDLRDYEGWALITGASAGIGREFARAIAAHGVNCALVARRRERLEDLADELNEVHGVECLPIPLDLSVEGCVDDLMDALGETPVGILVNNAGFGHNGPFETRDPERLAAMVKLNCQTPVLLTHAILPEMLDRGTGAVIMVSSLAGFIGAPYESVYGATKAFDLSLGEALHVELKPKGIDVITLCPANTATEFFEAEGMAEEQIKLATRMSASAEHVVDITLRRLGRCSIASPLMTSAAVMAGRVIPRSISAKLMGKGIRLGFNITD